MKLSVSSLILALSLTQVGAFTSPRPSAAGRVSSLNAATVLDEWQLLDNGSVVGSVRSHPTLNDGDIITTSPLANPSMARSQGTVQTLTGSQYTLGNPMTLKTAGSADADGVDRREFGGTAALAGLFAAGVGAGVGVTKLAEPPAQMTVPEVRLFGYRSNVEWFVFRSRLSKLCLPSR